MRGGTPVSARAAMQRPGAGASNLSSTSTASEADDDARAETIALLDDLKERLRKTETVSEQFQKQAQVLQSRLDEALTEQGKLEDRLHENEERLETLENDKRDALRQKREMESIYEAERSSMTKEREEMANREEEMQTIIQRLKDSLNQRSNVDEESRLSRRCKCIQSFACSFTNTCKRTIPHQVSKAANLRLHPVYHAVTPATTRNLFYKKTD